MSLLSALHSPLYAYLDANLADDFAQGHELSPTVRAAMAIKLRSTLATYAAYIPSRLVETQLAAPQPGRVHGAFWHGSLLFADLSGFTAFSEQLSILGKQGAEEVSVVVNKLFNALVVEVTKHHGMLLKFGGDALTAFFDEETLGAAHAAAAVSAALSMQQCMSEFTALETRAGTFRLGLRVGVHSGRVFSAEVGDTSHIELVVTGRAVNQVALAQEIAAVGQVVISDQTKKLLDGATLGACQEGFWSVTAMPVVTLPPAPLNLIELEGPSDLATLERLASQVNALHPYLVRNMPRRYLDPSAAEIGEFRPVSVLFVNFHDFSSILSLVEDDVTTAAAILNAYFCRIQIVVHRYDGMINKVDMYTQGDKLMALFGAPIAHEDDQLRAVRCALDLEDALRAANDEIATLIPQQRLLALQHQQLNTNHSIVAPPSISIALQQKIGINTGTVFAGRLGGAQRYEYTVMGPAVNLAARLMAVADDGAVLLSPATQAAVERQVVFAELPALHLKGLSKPVIPVRALHIRETIRGIDLESQGNLKRPALIGREEELDQLMREATVAFQGNGRVVAIVGEAGAGKSRLIEELIHRLVRKSGIPQSSVPPFQIFTGDCQGYEQHTPYAVMRSPLRHLLGITQYTEEYSKTMPKSVMPSAGMIAYQKALQLRVKQLAPELVRFTSLLGDVLGIELPESSLTQALSPEQRHNRLHELIIALLRGAATRDPLLLALDSVHWADAASLELLNQIAHSTAHMPILLLLNYRSNPPNPEPWSKYPNTTRIALTELTPEYGAQLITALLGAPPPLALMTLLEQTQGNPFFIEELVRTLIVSGILARNELGNWYLSRPIEQIAVPDSIEGLLVARLDQLDEPYHKLIQIAAVIGRRFPYDLIKGLYSNITILDESLKLLSAVEIILADKQERELVYLFRHAMLRDVVYEGILYSRRRELHRRVAQCIEELHNIKTGPIISDKHLTLLAWHYLHAEDWGPAFHYHIAAGVQAQQRYANHDALALFNTALEIAPHLAVSEDIIWLIMRVAELQERIGDLYALLGEYDKAESAYKEALNLTESLSGAHVDLEFPNRQEAGIAPQIALLRVRLHRLLAQVYERRSAYTEAFEWLNHGMEQANSATGVELTRCFLLGAGIYYRRGEYASALEWARMGLALAERMGTQSEQAHALLLMGNLWHDQGEFSASIQTLEQARILATQMNDITRLGDALNNLGMVYWRVGRWHNSIACYEQSLQISESIDDVQAMARTSNNLANMLVGRGELKRAGELFRYSNDQFERIGSILGMTVTTYNRGEVLLLQERPQEALALFEESIATFEQIKARGFLPEVLRLAAEATLILGDQERACAYAHQSLHIAEELGMAVESAVAYRMMGQIELNRGDLTAASQYLNQSRQVLEQFDNRYELGKVLFRQAQLAYANNQNESAYTLLQQAEQIFVELDAQRDLAMTRDLLTTHSSPHKS